MKIDVYINHTEKLKRNISSNHKNGQSESSKELVLSVEKTSQLIRQLTASEVVMCGDIHNVLLHASLKQSRHQGLKKGSGFFIIPHLNKGQFQFTGSLELPLSAENQINKRFLVFDCGGTACKDQKLYSAHQN